jgi:hypothetical protein
MTIHKDYHIRAVSAQLKETRGMPPRSTADEQEARAQAAEWAAHLNATTAAADWVGSHEEYTWDPQAPVEYTPENPKD